MHEFTTSQEIVKEVLKIAKKEKAKRILRIKLRIGKLTLLNISQIKFWVELAFEKTIARKAEVEIEELDSIIHCNNCNYEGELSMEDDPLYHYLPLFYCPSCGSNDIEIKQGRECILYQIRIEK